MVSVPEGGDEHPHPITDTRMSRRAVGDDEQAVKAYVASIESGPRSRFHRDKRPVGNGADPPTRDLGRIVERGACACSGLEHSEEHVRSDLVARRPAERQPRPDPLEVLGLARTNDPMGRERTGGLDQMGPDLDGGSACHPAPSPVAAALNPIFAVEFLHLNAHAPPFHDIRVRRALNFAIDRNRIARMYGGPFVATPTCQPLVPGFAGYRRYCPYTLRPTANGAYHGPDLAAAKRLVAASGTRGERVDVWGLSDEPVIPRELTAYVGGVLRSLGYEVRLHVTRFDVITPAMRRGHQMSTDGDWLPNYPAPSSYLPTFFACGASHG